MPTTLTHRPAPAAQNLSRAASHILFADDAAALANIHERDLNLVVWQRNLPLVLNSFAAALSWHRFDEEHRITISEAPALLQRILAQLSPAASAGRRLLSGDLCALVGLYGRLAGCDRVSIRLEATDGNSCSQFHVDWLGLRLVVTYAGPGTQFLPEWAVDRKALLANPENVCRNEAAITEVPAGAVALLKGSGYVGKAGYGIVHRSPPIAAGKGRRIIFVIDAA